MYMIGFCKIMIEVFACLHGCISGTLKDFSLFFSGDLRCGYSVVSHGLYLVRVNYPGGYFPAAGGFPVF